MLSSVINFLSNTVGLGDDVDGQEDDRSEGTNDDASVSEEAPASRYLPTVKDVMVVKAMLLKAISLPIEIVDLVLDHAEYWPHTTAFVQPHPLGSGTLSIYGTREGGNRFLVRTVPLGFIKDPHPQMDQYRSTQVLPLPLVSEHSTQTWQELIGAPEKTIEHPARKIVFTLRSHDQGWGGDHADHGTYHGSWTWFDVGLERFDPEGTCKPDCPEHPQDDDAEESPLKICALRPVYPTLEATAAGPMLHFALLPDEKMLQCNVVAESHIKEHVVVWRWTDDVGAASPAAPEQLTGKGRGQATGDGEFVRNLKLGDVVTVWAKSRFPGWVNHVESVKVEVFWAM